MNFNFNNVIDAFGGNTPLVKIYGANDYLLWEKPDFSGEYLTFEVLSNGNITWNNASKHNAISYSINNGSWTTITTTTTFAVSRGNKIRFKGENNSYYGDKFETTISFNLSGNIGSLVWGDNFSSGNYQFTPSNYFLGPMFSGCTGLVDASKLQLPFEAVKYADYSGLFKGCTALLFPPELPATSIGTERWEEEPYNWDGGFAYGSMFMDCTSLLYAPNLPAEYITQYCYDMMFAGCTSMVKGPEISAVCLPLEACYGMFAGCSNLNYIKCMATDFRNQATYAWVGSYEREDEHTINIGEPVGVASNGTFIKASGATWYTGIDGIPTGWTVQNV